jgi:chaperone required for assembly of F1-ATPase
MHVAQDAAALETLSGLVAGRNAWQLTALHDLVSLSGSLVIGLAVSEAHLCAKTAWPISRIDELWQIEQWGEDAEAAEAADLKFEQFSHAERFYSLVHST